MVDFLDRMAAGSRRRAASARQREGEARLRRRVSGLPSPPALDLERGGFDLIAEVKRRSPGGFLAADRSPRHVELQAARYFVAGARAISVLTEPEEFGGSLADLAAVARGVPVPVMRKDFLVEPYQLFEARAWGAAGALLVLRLFERAAMLDEMIDAASEARVFLLLEVFDERDIGRAVDACARALEKGVPSMIGVNCRDLATLDVAPRRFEELRGSLPAGVPWVAESGLETDDDVRRVVALGYRAALVGSALMRSADPAARARGMIAAGRRAARERCESM